MNDTISDLLIRISNAKGAGKTSLQVPFSKMKIGILEVLKKEGYLSGYSSSERIIDIELSGAIKGFSKIVNNNP